MSILLLRDALFCLHVYKYVYILLQIDSISINIVPKHAAFPDFVYAPISNCSRNSALRASNMAPQLQLA